MLPSTLAPVAGLHARATVPGTAVMATGSATTRSRTCNASHNSGTRSAPQTEQSDIASRPLANSPRFIPRSTTTAPGCNGSRRNEWPQTRAMRNTQGTLHVLFGTGLPNSPDQPTNVAPLRANQPEP